MRGRGIHNDNEGREAGTRGPSQSQSWQVGAPACSQGAGQVSDQSDKDVDAAQAALEELQSGLSHAKELVERTRSLLNRETPAGEADEAPADEGESSGAPEGEGQGEDPPVPVDPAAKPA